MRLYKKRLLSVVTLIGMFISLLPAIPAAAADGGVRECLKIKFTNNK